ncbi:MAG: LAGLIDADG family homing endonuclease [Candidatus Aenigmarchaeota archaeon]|nr:LAGLIDADG family homing endonuclease [Candidatus Aenigmarchaeota archaeon]
MKLNCVLKKNRIWIPKKFQHYLQNNFCKIVIRQNKKQRSFISKLGKDKRLVIPKEYLAALKDRSIQVQFTAIKNYKRPKIFVKNNRIDFLSFIPQRTLSGFEVLAFPLRNKIFAWYFASKGRPKSILISRFVDGGNFFRFIGYYRSEGGKPRLSYRRGREFSFTNKNLDVLSDFITLFKQITSIKILKATISYNPFNKVDLNEIKSRLITLGLNEKSITKRVAKVKEFTVRIYVTNSLLSETINNAENILRKYIIKSPTLQFITQYLRGIILGDGSFYRWRDKKGSLHSRLQIFESDESAILDISKLLAYLGVHGNFKKSNKKMFTYTAFLNWQDLLKLYYFRLLGERTKYLRSVIKKHKRFRSLKYLAILPQKFLTSDFMRLTKKNYSYSATWLRDRQREGLIRKIKHEEKQNVWRLTDEGKFISNLLKTV